MPLKTIRILAWTSLLLGLLVIQLNRWFPSFIWFLLLLAVGLGVVIYLLRKHDDWMIEEGEQIKKDRGKRGQSDDAT